MCLKNSYKPSILVSRPMKTNFFPLQQLISRAETSLDDSDVAFFYDLIAIGELITKLSALFLIANIESDVERTRYRYEYQLVRADGIGTFAEVIGNVLRGSTADVISSNLRDMEVVEMTCKCKEGTWQRKCNDELNACLDILELQYNQLTNKSSLLIWFTNFAILRNKTKGHGSITSQQCSNINKPLANSMRIIIENLSIFKRPWAFMHRNYSGKYRISPLNEVKGAFDFLKKHNNYEYIDGIYCITDKPRIVNLIYSDSELSYFEIVNGNFTDKGEYECLNYYTNKKSIKNGEDYLLPPTKLPESQTSGTLEMNVCGDAFTNLPIGLSDYIKRDELEEELTNILLDNQRYPIVTLKGRGGIGKTSLAIQVINNLLKQHPKRYDVVVWFSSRDVDLLMEGPKAVRATVANQKDIAAEYFSQVGKIDVLAKKQIEMFSEEFNS